MSVLVWDNDAEKTYSTGVEKVTLGLGKLSVDIATASGEDAATLSPVVGWNGVTSVSDTPSGAEATTLYADNIKWMSMLSNEEQGSSIEAYMYPDEWEYCDGYSHLGNSAAGIKIGQQKRSKFCYTYQTKKVDDSGNEFDILHILYNGLASPSEVADNTINDSPEATTFSWEISHSPVRIPSSSAYPTLKPYCNVEVNLSELSIDERTAVEDLLYGTASTDPAIPTLAKLLAVIDAAAPEAPTT